MKRDADGNKVEVAPPDGAPLPDSTCRCGKLTSDGGTCAECAADEAAAHHEDDGRAAQEAQARYDDEQAAAEADADNFHARYDE